MKKETLYGYIRVSTDEQRIKDYSPESQKRLAKKKAEDLGMKIEILEEGGESASNDDFSNRPVFLKLLHLVKEGAAKHIWAFDQSRLSRSRMTKARILNDFQKYSVQLHTFSKKYDMDKPEDILLFEIIQSQENYDTALRKARFQLGYVSANQRGRFLKGIPPYGFKKLVSDDKSKNGMLVVDQEEKKIFLKLVDLYLNHDYGTNQLANWLNENNIPTKTSKVLKNGYKLNAGIHNRKQTKYVQKNRWNPGTINTMFNNPIITGVRKFKTGKDTWETVAVEPLIDQETFDLIQEKKKMNVIMKKKEDKYFYLLKGMLQCGVCGNPMHGRIKPNRSENTYVCNSKRDSHHSCGSRGINIDKLNTIAWNSFTTSMYYHKMISEGIQQQLKNPDSINNRIAELKKEQEKLTADKAKNETRLKNHIKKANDDIPEKIYKEIMEEYKLEAKQIEKQIASCQANIGVLGNRLKKNTANESKIVSVLRLYQNIQKRVKELSGQKVLDKKSQVEAHQILKDCIDNVVVTWDNKKREHIVELKFLPLSDGANTETKKMNIPGGNGGRGGSNKINRIELPPITHSTSLDDGTITKFDYKKSVPPILTQQKMWLLLAEADSLSPVKFHWHITVFCFSTNYRSSNARCSKSCVNRWKKER